MIDKKWISKHGFILPSSRQEQSENGVLFTVVYFFLYEMDADENVTPDDFFELTMLIRRLWETNAHFKYRTLPNDPNPRFSLDNAMAVAAFSRATLSKTHYDWAKHEENLYHLPVWKYYYRFYDVIPFLLLMKYPWMRFLILPTALVWFFTVIPCLIYKPTDSSGRQLAFVKCYGLQSHFLLYLCELALSARGLSFPTVFKTYYPEHGHPIPEKAAKVWNL